MLVDVHCHLDFEGLKERLDEVIANAQTAGVKAILTSGVTLLVVLAIFIYGGEILSNFAFALFAGFISGVYSTVFIASPLVLAFQPRKKPIGK